MENKKLKKIIKISNRAGEMILKKLEKSKSISYKNKINLVTNVDKEVENFIIENLKKITPNIPILAEESSHNFNSKTKWIVDPLDGTTNFVHGFPFFCVSIAFIENNTFKIGIIHDPIRKETFYAEKNRGAYLNHQSIQVTQVKTISKSLLSTGFSYGFKTEEDDNTQHFIDFLYKSRAVRRPGAAALDLCYVACGRLDGFWELHLSPWDTAAGVLIVKEAGGEVTNFKKKDYNLEDNTIVASNSFIHNKMIKILNRQS